MSRIRSVHPGLWTDERFVSVQPMARLMFMGIWNECDDQGIFEWSPLKLKMRLLPADNADAAALLDELEEVGSLLKFIVAGKTYGAVRSFTRFQRPKKPNAVHPVTPQAKAFAAGSSEPVPDQFPTEEEIAPQMEEGGGDKEEKVPPKPPRKRRGEGKTLLPEDWVAPPVAELTPQAKACAEQWTRGSYETVAEGFACYWRRERKMTADWRLTFSGWVIREHSKVMRDQKFGNAPPTVTPLPVKTGPAASPEQQAADLERTAAFYRKIDRDLDADELERKAAALRRSNRPQGIGDLAAGFLRDATA